WIDSRDIIFFVLMMAFVLFTTAVILRSYQAASDKLTKGKTSERLLYSSGGVVGMFVVMVALYIISNIVNLRADVTAEKVHTLTPGTRQILAHLDSRVTMRFYCSQGENGMPPQFKAYAHRVQDLLNEYVDEGKGKLLLEKYDPQPDTEAESAATLNGIEGRPGPNGDKIYLGLVVSLLNEKFAIPFMSPDRERLLEYDVSRAISRVASQTRPAIGIMSGLKVFGETFNPMMHADQTRREDWAFVGELKKDFLVVPVPLEATNIDEHIKLLVVYHPVNISDASQYAIDQFIMRGGKVIAFLDPHAYFDQNHDRMNNMNISGDNAAKSNLDKLLKAWGLVMDTDHVLADRSYASHNNQTGDIMPTLLMITADGVNSKEAATSKIDNLFVPFAGAFTGKPVDGLQLTPLVSSSSNSELIDTLIATAGPAILKAFKPSNQQYPIALRLNGKFKTAFPKNDGLKESPASGEVILVADTDMLNDKVAVRVEDVMGHKVMRPLNGNLNLFQSMVEQMSGDDDLITSRNRASMNRPFTRVKDMEARAGRIWEEKMRELETHKREMKKKVDELQAQSKPGQNVILTSAQERELDEYQRQLAAVDKELKKVVKNLRKDTDALEFRAKVLNIGAMPVIVALSGMCLAIVKTRRRTALLKR
ncbi:MAG: Gldg family protein, partial [Limisphaerales bacterium]